MSIITLNKVNDFSKNKESYESTLIFVKLRETLLNSSISSNLMR